MPDAERVWFARTAEELASRYLEEIRCHAITIRKEAVFAHIRSDENKLYYYMIGLSLLPFMAKHPKVRFFPDARSIKVGSGNSLHDYLQTRLWFSEGVNTTLTTCPSDSSRNTDIQFADMLSGIVQAHYEDGRSRPFELLRSRIYSKRLYFRESRCGPGPAYIVPGPLALQDGASARARGSLRLKIKVTANRVRTLVARCS